MDSQPVRVRAGVALNAFNEHMGVMDIIGVDPDFHRRGIASQLTRDALDHCVGGEWTSRPWKRAAIRATRRARTAYESLGFTPLPVTRYLKLLDE